MDLISVIVPVYNVEKYLNKCVESIVNQTYKNLEIILVDDGSTDSSGTICDQWAKKDNRIRIIHKENGGLSDARNKGLSVANGDYIGFVDSDDWIDLDFYKTLIINCKRYNADLAACKVIKEFDDHEETFICDCTKELFSPEEAIETLLNGKVFLAVVWNKLYKRTLFTDVEFPVGKIHEDEFITYKVLGSAKRLVFNKSTYYYYRQREGSIMSTISYNNTDVLEAYYQRCIYIKEHFPNLYCKSKIGLINPSYYYYKELRKKGKHCTEEILNYNHDIHFSFSEIVKMPLKSIIHIIRAKLYFLLFK